MGDPKQTNGNIVLEGAAETQGDGPREVSQDSTAYDSYTSPLNPSSSSRHAASSSSIETSSQSSRLMPEEHQGIWDDDDNGARFVSQDLAASSQTQDPTQHNENETQTQQDGGVPPSSNQRDDGSPCHGDTFDTSSGNNCPPSDGSGGTGGGGGGGDPEDGFGSILSPEEEKQLLEIYNRMKAKGKRCVMQRSGQTNDQRRLGRKALRTFFGKLAHSSQADCIDDPSNNRSFHSARDRSNFLFETVRYPREGVMDGDNLKIISERSVRRVERMSEVPRYDAQRLIQKLHKHFVTRDGSNRYFDWRTLGREAGVCFSALPSCVSFLSGAVSVDYVPKERKKRLRQPIEEDVSDEEDDDEGRKPKQLKQDGGSRGGGLTIVQQHFKIAYKVLQEHTVEGIDAEFEEAVQKGADVTNDKKERAIRKRIIDKFGIDLVHYCFDPKSFTKTVENIFHLSFLVKNGQAKLSIRDDGSQDGNGCPTVRYTTKKEQERKPPSRQAIVSLTMQDWRDMCTVFGVKESLIPHRK